MLTKSQFLDIVKNESEILKHLHSKLGAASLEYRPTAGQRTTLELLRYLSFAPEAGARAMIEGNWDGYGPLKEEAEKMSSAGFAAAIDRQRSVIAQLLERVTEKDLSEREATYVTGEKMPLGQALVMGPLRWLTAYRMQLFLYAKASGAGDLATANAWIGRDPEKKAS